MVSKSKLNVFFIVQGEGRGHLTQAIALEEILISAGHNLVKVMVGQSNQRTLPSFFSNHFKDILSHYPSPNLIRDKTDSGILMGRSFFSNVLKIPRYLKSTKIIYHEIKKHKPDLIINFHEILTGAIFLRFRPKPPIISIAHQYIYSHFRFYYPNMPFFHKLSLELVNKLSTIGSKKKFALNYNHWENQKNDNLYLMPPLLRNKIKSAKATKGNYILVYLLNSGNGEEIKKWSSNHPEQMIHAFWDQEAEETSASLHFHKIDDSKYIEYLAGCKGFASSAGFEGICEAMYLGKPVMAVPVKNHPEQLINAHEAIKARAGMMSEFFDFHDFIYLTDRFQPNLSFKDWINQGHFLFLKEIHSIFE